MQTQNPHMGEQINADIPAHTNFVFPSAEVSGVMNNW